MMCGPDCLAYLFPPANAAEIARACGTDDSGTRLGAMAQWVETQGRVAVVREHLTWDDLRAYALACEIIVPWWSIFDEDGKRANAGDGHYSVVLGVNAFFIALYDPDIGGVRNLPRAVFEAHWYDFEICPDGTRHDYLCAALLITQP